MKTLIRKCDTIFQIVYNMVQDDRRKVPLHIGNSQSIHDKRSKQLIHVFNRLGLCISYNELERIDCSLASETINSCTEPRSSFNNNNFCLYCTWGYGWLWSSSKYPLWQRIKPWHYTYGISEYWHLSRYYEYFTEHS